MQKIYNDDLRTCNSCWFYLRVQYSFGIKALVKMWCGWLFSPFPPSTASPTLSNSSLVHIIKMLVCVVFTYVLLT